MQVYVNECYNIEDQTNSCYLHPEGGFVGVCPLCLNERLIILASLSRQSHYCLHRTSFNFCSDDSSFFRCGNPKKPALQKIFSLGSDILHRLEFRHQKSGKFQNGDVDESTSTSSQEESYISIKIEDNGLASWERKSLKNKQSCDTEVDAKKKTTDSEHVKHNIQEKTKTVSEPEHPKPKAGSKKLRWHNQVGQLIKKRGTMRCWVCHASIDKVVEGVEVRKGGWMRTLIKRREPKKE